jgi:predicted kinase
MTGRKGETSNALDAVNLWAATAKEYKCWEQPMTGSNDESKIIAFDGKDIRHYVPVQKYKGTMTMLSGLPGAGKDTWIRKHLTALPMVSLDAVREELDVDPTDNQGTVLQTGKEQLRQQLRTGNDFVFNATNLTRDIRTPWIQLARDYGYRINIVYLEPPIPQVLKQNSSRGSKKVPEYIIHKLVDKLSPPTPEEAHTINLVSNTI